MTEDLPREKRWILFLLIGCLSMFMAEVFAGSSQMWFIDPWSLLVTYWLYLGHLLLFLNLAMRTERTSVPQLYLWGVLFALYEAWVTKVLWFGYPGSEGPVIALAGGIAIFEFFTLVFFWHPVLAFIMPILIYESFALSDDSQLKLNQRIFLSHLPYLKKSNNKSLYFFTLLIILGATFLSFNAGYNIIVVAIAIGGSIGLIYLFFRLSSEKNPNSFSIHSLKLGKKGFIYIWFYIILLYLVTFFVLLPERIPTAPLPYIIIICFYGFIGIMLFISKPTDETNLEETEVIETISASFFFKLFGLLFALAMIYCLLPVLGIIVAIVFFLGIFILAPVLFVIYLIKALRN